MGLLSDTHSHRLYIECVCFICYHRVIQHCFHVNLWISWQLHGILVFFFFCCFLNVGIHSVVLHVKILPQLQVTVVLFSCFEYNYLLMYKYFLPFFPVYLCIYLFLSFSTDIKAHVTH